MPRRLRLGRQLQVRPGSTVAELQAANARLQRELDAANNAYRALEGRIANIQFAPLNPETDRALAQLASQYPNLLRYDASRGMLRFASDMTFASGSADVQDAAQASLRAFQHLNSFSPLVKTRVSGTLTAASQRSTAQSPPD